MNPWIISTLTGIALGMVFYGCVRLRMHFGPRVRDRYGENARHIFWVFIIVCMVLLANSGLILLRSFLPPEPANLILLELWFAVTALIVGFLLVYRRITR